MNKQAFELQVLVNGRPVKESTFNGDTYIEARRGTQYSLKLRNNTSRRALAVFSVDGIDVLKGGKAEESGGGYIVDSYSSIDIKGFRVDNSTVSVFKFDNSDKSYAAVIGAKTAGGKTQKTKKNCGVIGVKITLEKEAPLPTFIPYPVYTRENPFRNPFGPQPDDRWTITCNSSRSLNSVNNKSLEAGDMSSLRGINATYACSVADFSDTPQTPNFTLGTSWGEKISDSVEEVSFEKSNEFFTMSLFYGERDELEAYGVNFYPAKKVGGFPKAFGDRQYCLIP